MSRNAGNEAGDVETSAERWIRALQIIYVYRDIMTASAVLWVEERRGETD